MRVFAALLSVAGIVFGACAPGREAEVPDDSSRAADPAAAIESSSTAPAGTEEAAPPRKSTKPATEARTAEREREAADRAKRDSIARKDSLLLERELERIRNEPRRVPPYPPAERPPDGTDMP